MSSPAYTPAQLLADLLTAKSQSANAAAESIAALGLGSYSSAQSAMVRIGQGVVPRSNTLGPLEAYFGVDRSAFTSNAAAHSAAVKLGLRGSNVAPAPLGSTPVPLITRIQAGNLTEVVDPFQPGDGYDILYTDVPVSRGTFALEIEGESMEPIFQEGDRVIIDPEVCPRPGDYVAAHNGSQEATFKKYRPRGTDERGNIIFELVPLNDDYATLRSDKEPLRVIGTMVELRKYRRK